jgi:hypothetical protein
VISLTRTAANCIVTATRACHLRNPTAPDGENIIVRAIVFWRTISHDAPEFSELTDGYRRFIVRFNHSPHYAAIRIAIADLAAQSSA